MAIIPEAVRRPDAELLGEEVADRAAIESDVHGVRTLERRDDAPLAGMLAIRVDHHYRGAVAERRFDAHDLSFRHVREHLGVRIARGKELEGSTDVFHRDRVGDDLDGAAQQ